MFTANFPSSSPVSFSGRVRQAPVFRKEIKKAEKSTAQVPSQAYMAGSICTTVQRLIHHLNADPFVHCRTAAALLNTLSVAR